MAPQLRPIQGDFELKAKTHVCVFFKFDNLKSLAQLILKLIKVLLVNTTY